MPAVKRVLIVGGGVAGLTLGVALGRKGIRPDIVEITSGNAVLGLGIALLGPTLRALESLALLESCIEQGFAYSSFIVRRPDGEIVRTVALPRLLGQDRPAAVGIMRPLFHHILAQACAEAGASIRFNTTVSAVAAGAGAVEVAFTDGERGVYDLVVGADGAQSKIRTLLWGEEPKPNSPVNLFGVPPCHDRQTSQHSTFISAVQINPDTIRCLRRRCMSSLSKTCPATHGGRSIFCRSC